MLSVSGFRSLCAKFPRKHSVLMNFLASMLRDEVRGQLSCGESESCMLFTAHWMMWDVVQPLCPLKRFKGRCTAVWKIQVKRLRSEKLDTEIGAEIVCVCVYILHCYEGVNHWLTLSDQAQEHLKFHGRKRGGGRAWLCMWQSLYSRGSCMGESGISLTDSAAAECWWH